MLTALWIVATEEGGASHAPFYVLGIVLAVLAVVVGVLGVLRKETFPPSAGASKAVMGIAAILVIATCASAVLTA